MGIASLDPTWKVEQLAREPLDRFKIGTRRSGPSGSASLRPTSGSASTCSPDSREPCQMARARSLVLKPDVVVLDEPTSALDVTVQADIIEVLLSLQANLGLTYVSVSHDLALVRRLAHTVSVMHRGRIVEHGTVTDI